MTHIRRYGFVVGFSPCMPMLACLAFAIDVAMLRGVDPPEEEVRVVLEGVLDSGVYREDAAVERVGRVANVVDVVHVRTLVHDSNQEN